MKLKLNAMLVDLLIQKFGSIMGDAGDPSFIILLLVILIVVVARKDLG